jgi:hypothetical protein
MLLFFERERMLLNPAIAVMPPYNILIFYFSIRVARYLSVLLGWLRISLTTSVHQEDRWMLTLQFY